MIFIAMFTAIGSFFLAGMQASLIIVNKQDKLTVRPMQYIWTAILILNGLYFFISSIGYYSCDA
jgi:hypothetical protein